MSLWLDADELHALTGYKQRRKQIDLDAPVPRIAVENPVPHRYAVERIGRPYDFTTQPYEHGDPYTKRTAFWLKGLAPLVPTEVVEDREPAVHRMSPGPDRWKARSRTYPGLARAMAAQWSTHGSSEGR